MANMKEGKVAKTLEKQTAKIPSDVYLWAALGTMVLSMSFFVTGKKHSSMFFGQWAPSLLVIGLYNKLVKVEGHDQETKGEDGVQKFPAGAKSLSSLSNNVITNE
jgi:hypothetical protein